MDPVSAMVLTAAGGAIAGGGALYSGQAQSNQNTYLAGVARANQTIAAQNANWETQSGEGEAQQAGLRAEDERAHSKVAAAGGNIDVTRGTPALIGQSITE